MFKMQFQSIKKKLFLESINIAREVEVFNTSLTYDEYVFNVMSAENDFLIFNDLNFSTM